MEPDVVLKSDLTCRVDEGANVVDANGLST